MSKQHDNNFLNSKINKSVHKKKGKYIVFDVDETLGYFSQLGAFMDALSFYNKDFSGSVFGEDLMKFSTCIQNSSAQK